jgi:hypothetical protein
MFKTAVIILVLLVGLHYLTTSTENYEGALIQLASTRPTYRYAYGYQPFTSPYIFNPPLSPYDQWYYPYYPYTWWL